MPGVELSCCSRIHTSCNAMSVRFQTCVSCLAVRRHRQRGYNWPRGRPGANVFATSAASHACLSKISHEGCVHRLQLKAIGFILFNRFERKDALHITMV